MFASLKNKIKEETGNDISKLTKTWRTGGLKSQSSLNSVSSENGSRSGSAIMTEEEISAELESYLKERMEGNVDRKHLEQEYMIKLEQRLQEKDAEWEMKLQEVKKSLEATYAEEIALAMAAARAAQAEAQREAEVRARLQGELSELNQYKLARDKLQALGEELESQRRDWSREKLELEAQVSAAQVAAQRAQRDLELLKASLPPDQNRHQTDDEVTFSAENFDEERLKRLFRERAVLARQLEEAQLALEDIKTSWSGQIATLETQVARVSRACGEEASERRRAEAALSDAQHQVTELQKQLNQKQNALENANAKITRLSGEVRSLAAELKALKTASDQHGERVKQLEVAIQELSNENEELSRALQRERESNIELRKQLDNKVVECFDCKNELKYLNELVKDLKEECRDLDANIKREILQKDEALLRNAQISQMLQICKTEMREQGESMAELKLNMSSLEEVISTTKQITIEYEVMKGREESLLDELGKLRERKEELEQIENNMRTELENLENQLTNCNKVIKTQNHRIADMKKTFQRELQQFNKCSVDEEADISRKYLKHVVMRFLTAQEVEAKQLTRALATLLRLNAQEEALLRNSLPTRNGISHWFGISGT